jgi:hypothetical protein
LRLPAGPTSGFLPEAREKDDPFIIQKMIQLGLDQTLLFEILVTLIGQPGRKRSRQFSCSSPRGPSAAARGRAERAGGQRPLHRRAPRLPSSRPRADPGAAGRGARLGAAGKVNWAIDGASLADGKPMIAKIRTRSSRYGGDVRGAPERRAMTRGPPRPRRVFAGHTRGALTPTSAPGDVMDLGRRASEQGARSATRSCRSSSARS